MHIPPPKSAYSPGFSVIEFTIKFIICYFFVYKLSPPPTDTQKVEFSLKIPHKIDGIFSTFLPSTRFIPLAGTLKRGTFSPIFGVCVEKVSQQGYVFFLLLVCVCVCVQRKASHQKKRGGGDNFGGILDWWKFKFLFILNGIKVEATYVMSLCMHIRYFREVRSANWYFLITIL